ncbi:transcriptional repressor [candidate division KSB1 bacterium]|nr:transcriptional repressor [candidate division KSB1 bacterium]
MNLDSRTELLNEFVETCRQAELSITPQRLAVYKALLRSDNHPSPDMIYKSVLPEFPTISFATVYKILETFDQNGIISKVTALHNKLRYDPIKEHHHHIICVKCKKIIDIKSDDLDKLPIPSEVKEDNELIDFTVHFNVICSECRKKD